MSADNLSGQQVSSTFQRLLQLSENGGYVIDGTGSAVLYLPISVDYATSAGDVSPTDLSHLVTTSSFYAFTSSYYIDSASFASRFSNITVNTSSLATTGSNTFVGNQIVSGTLTTTGQIFGTASWALSSSQAVSSSHTVSSSYSLLSQTASYYLETDPIFTSRSGSFATTSSNAFIGDQTITGSLVITQNLTVLGSSSITYITASQLSVSASYISVNVFEPAQRFGGLYVYDSGSLSHQATASISWDSLNNKWVYSNASGSSYMGGGLISGPRNTGSLGDETYPTLNRVVKGQGADHIMDSNITDDGSLVSINSNTEVTGSLKVAAGVTASLYGTSSWAENSTTASFILGSGVSGNIAGNANNITAFTVNQNVGTANQVTFAGVTASLFGTASWATNVVLAQTASYVLNAVSSSHASTASYVENAQTASYVNTAQTASYTLNAVSSSFASTASFVQNAQTASYVVSAISSSIASTASYVENAQTASFVLQAVSASYATLSQTANTASYVLNAVSSSFASTASYIENAQTASYVLQAVSSSFASTASYVQNAQSASYVLNAISSSYSSNADLLDNKDSSTFATTGSNLFTATQTLSGSLQLNPTIDPGASNTTSSFFFVSSSTDNTEFNLHYRNNGALWETHWLEERTDTGIVWGGVLTFTGTTMSITPGAGLIVNHNANTGSHGDTVPTYVQFGPITASATFITSSQVTYLLIDENGSLVQQTSVFTPQQYNEKLPLGYIFCLTTSSISSYADARVTTYGQDEQQSQFIRAFGPLKVNGYDIAAQTGSLKISIASGRTYRAGGFYTQDANNPSIYDSSTVPTGSLVRIYRDPAAVGGFRAGTNLGLPFTDIDPTKWDDGSGTLQTVGANEWTIQRVFQGVVNNISYVYYGQNKYDSLNAAVQSITTEAFVEAQTSILALPFIGYVISRGNTTDLGDTTNNKIINSGLFRNTAGSSGGGGVATTNLNDLSDVTITSPSTGEALIYNAGIWENGTPLNSTSASYSSTASYVTLAQTASFVTTAQTASYVLQAVSSSFATTASYALSASWADNVTPAGPNKAVQFNNNGVLSGSSFFTYDAANTQLQHTGSILASGMINVNGSVTATSFSGNGAGLTGIIAASASYVNGSRIKSNAVSSGTFTGNPKKATVTFSSAYPDTNYSITITGEDARTWTIESKQAGSFVINANSNTALSGTTYWQTINYGEFNS